MTFPQIRSGGQAGADRAGLDWAIATGLNVKPVPEPSALLYVLTRAVSSRV